MNRNPLLLRIALCGVIAALYTAASLALTPLSFGNIQLRAAEALTLLPVLFPEAILGVTLGCGLTNAIGAVLGANILGPLDVLFGTAATLIAALLTRRLGGVRFRGIPWLAALPPVLVNALIIGAELSFALTGSLAPLPFLIFAGEVALGQIAACFLLGLPLVAALEKNCLHRRLYGR